MNAVAVVAALVVAVALSVTAGGGCCPDNADVTVYADGSGVQWQGDMEVRTFPPGTFHVAGAQ